MWISLIFIFSITASAIDFEDGTSPELIKSARAQAMGGAYLSAVDDAWSAFYNPAGLGSIRELSVHPLNFHLETNKGFVRAVDGVGDSLTKYEKSFDADGMRDLLEDEPGVSLARIQLFPHISYRYITLGYMYHNQQRAKVDSDTMGFEVAQRVDSGPVLATNLSLWGGVLKLGASGVLLSRKELKKEFASGAPTTLGNADYKVGTTTYLTAGMRLTLPVRTLPTLSAVYRNAGTSGWYNLDRGGAPDEINRSLDASLSVTPIFSRTTKLHFEIGMRDITQQYDISSKRRFNLGLELAFSRQFFLRAGYSDAWGSGGIGFKAKDYLFDLTTYAVEASDDETRAQEDRRFVFSISSGY